MLLRHHLFTWGYACTVQQKKEESMQYNFEIMARIEK